MSVLPELVAEEECRALTRQLSRVGRREAVLLQMGDCAERFADATASVVADKVAHLERTADTIRAQTGCDVVRVGRMGGQYAKPRSRRTEILPDGTLVTSYFGDAVNDLDDPGARRPDPRRLLTAYHCAALTLAWLRRYRAQRPPADHVYASHEALLLDYEWPLLATGARGRFASSGHLPWIGHRTRSLNGRHVELLESVTNSVGVKIGPGITPEQACRLSRRLNPEACDGKLLFITRFGADRIDDELPPLVDEVARKGHPVIWVCDAMHGNTMNAGERKTRTVRAVKNEIRAFVRIMKENRQWPGGLHLETTHANVTECVDGRLDHGRAPHFPRYLSACDPRLNGEQTAEVADYFSTIL